MKIKHAVLMVSYNQEKYIREAIESIMNNDVHNFSMCLDNICKMYGTKLAYETNKDLDLFWNNMSIKKEWEIRY